MEAENLRFTPIFPESSTVETSLCLAVRSRVDPVSGWFVPLYERHDAVVFLGALLDGSGRVREWLEIWVQTLSRVQGGGGNSSAAFNNAYLDQQWKDRCEILDALQPKDLFAGAWQTQHPPPLQYVPEKAKLIPVSPTSPDEDVWCLCQDDSVLRELGLGSYSQSSHRYLYLPRRKASSPFIPLQREAAPHLRLAKPSPEQGFRADCPVFNPEGGLLMIRRLLPLTLPQFKRILEGYGYEGMGQADDKVHLSKTHSALGEQTYQLHNHGLIFSGKKGRPGRLLECFLLKLMLFQEAVATVAVVTKREKRPFLSLRAEDFRVRLHEGGGRLPLSWNFGLGLARTTESAEISVAEGGQFIFEPVRPLAASPYLPKELASLRNGTASLRIRGVEPGKSGTVVIEGTLSDHNMGGIGVSDVLEISLLILGKRERFLARPLRGQSLAETELRFLTIPRALDSGQFDALVALKASWIDSVGFRVTPLVASPADLYSLAVIGLETLIDTRKVSLAVALDECISLATLLGRESERPEPLPVRRARVIELEPRFRRTLGPQNLCREADETAMNDAIPAEVWWSYFDILIRMFPGLGRDSIAADLGDVNPQALDSCYLDVLAQLDTLLELTRSLLFGDLASNREAAEILSEFDES